MATKEKKEKQPELNPSARLAKAAEQSGGLTEQQKAISILKTKGGFSGGAASRAVFGPPDDPTTLKAANVTALAEIFDQDAGGAFDSKDSPRADELVRKILDASAVELAQLTEYQNKLARGEVDEVGPDPVAEHLQAESVKLAAERAAFEAERAQLETALKGAQDAVAVEQSKVSALEADLATEQEKVKKLEAEIAASKEKDPGEGS